VSAQHVTVIYRLYTVFRKKTPTYIFNYNSGISWSIIIIFCGSGKRNKYPTIYILTVLMTS